MAVAASRSFVTCWLRKIGLRQGEALGLRWQDVNLDAGVLQVRHALQWVTGGGWSPVEPKSERSRRAITMPDILVSSLRVHRMRQREDRLLAGSQWHENGFVFTSRRVIGNRLPVSL